MEKREEAEGASTCLLIVLQHAQIMRDSAFDFNDMGSSRRAAGKRSQRDGQRDAALFGKVRACSRMKGPAHGPQ